MTPEIINISTLTLDFTIGKNQPVFIIAEAGVNHNGDIKIAHELIDVAVDAKADAVKFQSFNVDNLLTKSAPKAEYQIKNTKSDETQYEMLSSLQLSKNDFIELQKHCDESKILFLSSPFDMESVDLLSDINVPVLKIPSGEITNLPLLKYVANLHIPLIISTGMSTLGEVKLAVDTINETGNQELILLHCVSNYPAADNESNLKAIDTLHENFKVPVGFSDHSLGINISLAAVARGACVIEKHLTIDKKMSGPDHCASLNPKEFIDLVKGIRSIESALGDGKKIMQPSERSTALIARKSLVATKNISKGTIIEESMIRICRPGSGISPSMLSEVLLSYARHDINEGEILKFDDLMKKDKE
jgi:N-acetylneuraminate synthase